MRYAFLPLLAALLTGCVIVPIADAGPCSAVTNARGCQYNPYVVRKVDQQTQADAGASQKADAPR
jgi:hypothetical protein